jgi:tetratricopeptide (TPR) repeat protein
MEAVSGLMSEKNASMSKQARPKTMRRRVVVILLLMMALALVSVPVVGQLFVAFDLYRAQRALADVELDRACDWLQAAERRQPNRADVQYWLAVAYRRHAQYRVAQEHLERAQVLGWPKDDIERQQMMILFQMGDVARAEPYLKNLVKRGGSDDMAEDVYEAMVIGYLADHQLSSATLCLDYWIKWKPDSLRARLLRAYFQSAGLPNPSGMLADLRVILRLAPGRLAERLALAELLLQQTRVDDALAECEICRRQAPDDPRVWLVLGLCHFRQGRIEEAKRDLEAAVTVTREAPHGLDEVQLSQAYVTLGQIASSVQEFESAARNYEEAVRHAPQDAAAAYGLGIALKKLGQDERADELMNQSKMLRSQSERLSDIKKDLGQDPSNVALRVEAANILLKQGLKAEAAVWMASALYHEPNLRVAHELIADLCEEQGKSAQAKRHRDEARNGTELAASKAPDGPKTPVGPNATNRPKVLKGH